MPLRVARAVLLFKKLPSRAVPRPRRRARERQVASDKDVDPELQLDVRLPLVVTPSRQIASRLRNSGMHGFPSPSEEVVTRVPFDRVSLRVGTA